MSDIFRVVEVHTIVASPASPSFDQADIVRIRHGVTNLVGRNYVAILEGRLCTHEPPCDWCADLWSRIASRTVRPM